jgi:hypothetical protein
LSGRVVYARSRTVGFIDISPRAGLRRNLGRGRSSTE